MGDLPRLDDVVAPSTGWMWAGRGFLRAALRVRYDNRVHGAEHVPRQGPVLLVSNHIGYLDGPVMFAVSPRRVHALTKASMFEGRLGYVIGKLGQIPVDRSVVDIRAVKACLRVLADGGVVGMYPEGERGAGDVSVTRRGAAYLALVSGAPVVPVAVLGTRSDGADMRSMPPRGSRLDTVFGAPVTFDRLAWPRTTHRVAEVQAEIQSRLAAHVVAASGLTGQTLPALPTSKSERSQ